MNIKPSITKLLKLKALVVICTPFMLKAQLSVTDYTNRSLITSPQSAPFTQYTKVPVSEFTGIPDIKIPLYNIKVDNFEMPISLSYYARGVQPNIHEGWVGTGWNLLAGAAITRKINGAPDELVSYFDSPNTTSTSSCPSCSNNTITIGPYSKGQKLGWFWNNGVCNTPDWTDIMGFCKRADGTSVCPPNYWGSYSLGDPSRLLVNDISADEFNFNIFGLSGAFFKGEDNNWHVRSDNEANITVSTTIGELQFQEAGCSQTTDVASTFKQFILTAGDGTQYIFGNNSASSITDDANAIEFNRSTALSSPLDVTTIAMAWHIVKIVFPTGKTISFTYLPRGGVQYTYNCAYSFYSNSQSFNPQSCSSLGVNNPYGTFYYSNFSSSASSPVLDINANITDPVYLSSISFPEGKLIFHSAPTNQADNFSSEITPPLNSGYGNYSAFQTNVINGGYLYQIVPGGSQNGPTNNYHTYPSVWMQLNDIEEDDYNGNKIKDIALKYTTQTSTTTRQFLQSVQTTGYYNNASGVQLPPYTCQYNSTVLPEYCTTQVDHWGFYNAQFFPFSSYGTSNFPVDYLNSRAPSSTYQQAGILTQLNYPTGAPG